MMVHIASSQMGAQSMWRIDASEINALRGAGGVPFTKLLDALIRADVSASGESGSSIATNYRVNKPDGGVDTSVDIAVVRSSQGWFQVPTSWQYKSTDQSEVHESSLRKEASKDEVVRLAAAGFAYRFCICDSLAVPTKFKWEQLLDDEIQRHVPGAPASRVLSSDDIADWVSNYPGLILQYFRTWAVGALPIGAWAASERNLTSQYVPVVEWASVQDSLRDHTSFSRQVSTAVFPIHGAPGTGKTRLVFETLNDLVGSADMVVYTKDDKLAQIIASRLAVETRAKAILVADECSLADRLQLSYLLNPVRDRVRVVTISSSEYRPRDVTPNNSLETMPRDTVTRVLEHNFPEVPSDARRNYADISGGFVRLAADLCHQHGAIIGQGKLDPALFPIREYLAFRLRDANDLHLASALAMFTSIGYKDEVADELDQISAMTGLPRAEVMRVCLKLKETTGFVQQGGRFFYVTPEIVAQSLFGVGWDAFAAPDVSRFVLALSGRLLEAFQNAVKRFGSEEARARVADFFHEWASSLEPVTIQDAAHAGRLLALCETSPEHYLPVLHRLVVSSTDEMLSQDTTWRQNGWGLRRNIVFLAERLAAFPDFYDTSEEILFRLAQCESEPGISNNASGVWRDLQRVMLSGTAVPFDVRLRKLLNRIANGDFRSRKLAITALGEIVGRGGTKTVGPAVVAGRVVPDEWRPGTWGEFHDYQRQAIAGFTRLVPELDAESLDAILSEISSKVGDALDAGLLSEVRSLIDVLDPAKSAKASLKNQVENYLAYRPGKGADDTYHRYLKDVRAWMETLTDAGASGQLLDLVSKDSWHYLDDETRARWRRKLESFAERILPEPSVIFSSWEWLTSGDARSAGLLGEEIGRRDFGASLALEILNRAPHAKNTSFCLGYVAGLIRHNPSQSELVRKRISELEASHPALAADLYSAAGDSLDPVGRAVAMVINGTLAPQYLTRYLFWVGSRNATRSELNLVLKRLAKEPLVDAPWIAATMRGLSFIEHQYSELAQREIAGDSSIRAQVKRILYAAISGEHAVHGYEWDRVARLFFGDRPSELIELGVAALLGDNYSLSKEVEDLLCELAPKYGFEILEVLARAGSSEEKLWRFQVGVHKELVAAIDVDMLAQWLKKTGVEGARLVARHLPRPYIDADNQNVVPEQTDLVLCEFGNDDVVVRRFSIGMHDLQVYSGPISDKRAADAEVAKRFKTSENPGIRRWAADEYELAVREAARWREREAERELD